MAHPTVTIDLDKIEHNAGIVVNLCRAHGIDVTGVTKATQGDPEVAAAMIRGGVTSIGEARIKSIERLTTAGIEVPFILLTAPSLSEVESIIEVADISLNSELSVLSDLSAAALATGKVQEVLIMVELGDLREGVLPEELDGFVQQARAFPGIRIKGIGANLSCFGGIVPSTENMNRLVQLAVQVEQATGVGLDWISGANSSALKLIASGAMPRKINHARIGEAILLGRETTHRKPWPDTHQDAFLLHAEVVEEKKKPSLPIGERAEDAFGQIPTFEDHGDIDRAILNIGREDVNIEGLIPLDTRLRVLGGTSEYLIVDVTGADGAIAIGDEIVFSLNYAALVASMASSYVEKRYFREVTK